MNPTISFNGESIVLEFPENEFSVTIPLDRCGVQCNKSNTPLPNQRGWKVLLDILKARYSASHRSERTIGTQASPTSYQIEQALKSKLRLTVVSKRKAKANLTLEDLGL